MLELNHHKAKGCIPHILTNINQSTSQRQYRNYNQNVNLSNSQLFLSNGMGQGSSFDFDDQSINNDSMVSFQSNITTQHLQCLQFIISKLVQNLFDISQVLHQSIQLNQKVDQEQHTFIDYLTHLKSLIPHQQLPFFMQFIQIHSGCQKISQWIYEKVPAQLGDELILVIHRIILAYLPIQQIESISNIPFNLFNIFCDPALRLIGYPNLFKYSQAHTKSSGWLGAFYKSFLTTVLLVLEGHFQNPYYPRILDQKKEIEQRIKQYKCKKLNKKISKLKKTK